mmetsp:Transcript_138013/g.384994  ORF Transcript_138013/g.384994 Transcript_138013/m.384994 type:complete len:263 (-) Transcript_138013:643-1431(-)
MRLSQRCRKRRPSPVKRWAMRLFHLQRKHGFVSPRSRSSRPLRRMRVRGGTSGRLWRHRTPQLAGVCSASWRRQRRRSEASVRPPQRAPQRSWPRRAPSWRSSSGSNARPPAARRRSRGSRRPWTRAMPTGAPRLLRRPSRLASSCALLWNSAGSWRSPAGSTPCWLTWTPRASLDWVPISALPPRTLPRPLLPPLNPWRRASCGSGLLSLPRQSAGIGFCTPGSSRRAPVQQRLSSAQGAPVAWARPSSISALRRSRPKQQ